MALTPDEVAAVLRLKGDHERILSQNSELISATQRAAERMRDIVDPPALRHLRETQERLMTMIDPPYLRELREANERMKHLIDPVEIRSLADMFAGVTATIDPEMFGGGVTKRLADQWKLLEPSSEYFAGMKALMPPESLSTTIARSFALDADAFAGISRTVDLFKTIQIPDYAKELDTLAGISIETQNLLSRLDLGLGFANLLNVNDITRSLVEYESDRLSRAYAGFAASVVNRPDWLASAPDFVRTTPSEMVFAQARFIRIVTTHEEIEEENAADEIWADVRANTLAYIEAVLPELNPRLMKSWKGAWDAARRRGPDWTRHSASSMRFVLVEALQAVAPIDEVKKSQVPTRYIKEDGQILRLGQINWLCEPVKNRTYGKVVRADLDSAMTIIEAMNEAVHRDDYEEIEDAFETMAVRAAVALCNLLRLWKAWN